MTEGQEVIELGAGEFGEKGVVGTGGTIQRAHR